MTLVMIHTFMTHELLMINDDSSLIDLSLINTSSHLKKLFVKFEFHQWCPIGIRFFGEFREASTKIIFLKRLLKDEIFIKVWFQNFRAWRRSVWIRNFRISYFKRSTFFLRKTLEKDALLNIAWKIELKYILIKIREIRIICYLWVIRKIKINFYTEKFD